jgi:WD40 repeat protein
MTLAWISRGLLQLMTIDGEVVGEAIGHLDWLSYPTFAEELDLILVTQMVTDGDVLTGEILGYSLASGSLERSLSSDQPISSFDITDGGRLAASGHSNGEVRIWDIAGGSLLHKLTLFANPVQIVFSPDGSLLAATDAEQGIWLVDVVSGSEVHYLELEPGGFYQIDFEDGGRVLTVVGSTGEVVMYGVKP